MITTAKKWTIQHPDSRAVNDIAQQLHLSAIAASVLVNRGITTPDEARNFLDPEISLLPNPFLLPDMEAAVQRIRRAIDSHEKILVYGDRDVDGVTSISIMVRTLKSFGAEPLWYIPSDEGYGVHNEIIDRYAKEGVTLIITVDCGISAAAQVAHARTLGIDTVVTDHHATPPAGIPEAIAVVNPKRADSHYPFAGLAGCAVAFKTAQALMLSFGRYFNEEMVVVDVETTGLNPQTDEILEIGAVLIKNGNIIRTFATLICPGKPIPPEVIRIHGITDAMVANAPSAETALRDFLAFIGERRLIAHNAEFDLGFLRHHIQKRLSLPINNPTLDTLEISRTFFTFPSHALGKLVAALRLPVTAPHRALEDAIATAHLFFRLEQHADVRMAYFRDSHLDTLALGTIADIMPLTSENRTIVKEGLKLLKQSRKAGLQALLERCVKDYKTDTPLTAKSISWGIAPVLNAAGRRGKADLAAQLLLEENAYEANKLVTSICKLNDERRDLQSENLEIFTPLLAAQCNIEQDKIFIVTSSDAQHGVTGIIASQIARRYHRPTVLMIIEGETATGAARSIDGFDITEAFSAMSDILIKYGGHNQAAGLTIAVEHIPEFTRRLRAFAEERITPELLLSELNIDGEIQPADISLELIRELNQFEPYGMGNPYPMFCLRQARILEVSTVGANNDHLKLKLSKGGNAVIPAMGWGLGYLAEELLPGSEIDLVVQPEINTWQEKQTVQLIIVDIQNSHS